MVKYKQGVSGRKERKPELGGFLLPLTDSNSEIFEHCCPLVATRGPATQGPRDFRETDLPEGELKQGGDCKNRAELSGSCLAKS